MKELTLLPLLAGLAAANSAGCGESGGNWYCQPIERVAYTGVGTTGSYQAVTGMDASTGACAMSPQSFSGAMAPLDEDLSIHLRGPLILRQFAAYTPSSGAAKVKREEPGRRHSHAAFHEKQRRRAAVAAEKRDPDGAMVVATINGNVVSWAQNAAPATAAADQPMVTATIDGKVVSWVNNYNPAAAATPAPAPPAKASPAPAPAANPSSVSAGNKAASFPTASTGSPNKIMPATAPIGAVQGDWTQVGYFDKDNQTAQGIAFLNTMGGTQGSGVWDMKFGNSLSYASADGSTGAPSMQVWNGEIKSKQELAIFSSTGCSDASAECGYARPGAVAHLGFAGVQKAFFFEFQMPDDGTSGPEMNMPAIWALNGKIARTQQYGTCSCWTSGCGELDIFETLDSGNMKAKSTVHMGTAGGSSDYFTRPTTSFLKLAVVMDGEQITITALDPGYDFSQVITGGAMAGIGSTTTTGSSKLATSVFRLTSK